MKAIPDSPEGYPDSFSYGEETKTLRVGEGEVSPVGPEVWEYGVSGLRPLRSWLAYRMREAAGRSSSPLDEVRPERWTRQMTTELLEIVWTLEETVAREPELAGLLDEVCASEVFAAGELPAPSPEQRKPPAKKAPPGEPQLHG